MMSSLTGRDTAHSKKLIQQNIVEASGLISLCIGRFWHKHLSQYASEFTPAHLDAFSVGL